MASPSQSRSAYPALRSSLSEALTVVNNVMQPSRQLDGIQVLGRGSEALYRVKHGQDMTERIVEAAWASICLRTI